MMSSKRKSKLKKSRSSLDAPDSPNLSIQSDSDVSLKDLKIRSNNPETIILLLDSKDTEILQKAIEFFLKYGGKSSSNSQVLKDLNLSQRIIDRKLYEHSEISVREVVLKLLSQNLLSCDESFDGTILQEYFRISLNFYTEGFGVLEEISSEILLWLLNEPRMRCKLARDYKFVNATLQKLNSASEVSLRNCYRILIYLIQTDVDFVEANLEDDFLFHKTVSDLENDSEEVQQLAIKVLAELSLSTNEIFAINFISDQFLSQIFNILEDENKKPLHEYILKILKQLMQRKDMAEKFFGNIYLTRLFMFLKTKDKESEKLEIFKVLIELAQHPEALEKLFQLNFVSLLIDFLKMGKVSQCDVCLGLARMMKHPAGLLKILEEDSVTHFLDVLKNNEENWSVRGSSIKALQILFDKSLDACEKGIDLGVVEIINGLYLLKYGEVPQDTFLKLINMVLTLSKRYEIRFKILDRGFGKVILTAVENSFRSAVLTSALLKSMCIFACENSMQDELIQQNSCEIILQCIKSPALVLKNAAAELIILIGKIPKFSEECIDHGILDQLLGDETSLVNCPGWSPAIESVLSADLSIKFLIRGRLDFTDVTGPNFFISKFFWKDFKILRSLIQDEVSPRYPLIIVNFVEAPSATDLIVNVSPRRFLSQMLVDCHSIGDSELSYCRQPCDPYLRKYLNSLRELFSENGVSDSNMIDSNHASALPKQVKIIAEFVASQMSGPDGDEPCFELRVREHLKSLKIALNCNIIPLGKIRVGGHFERALLFKVLADQLGVPSTLDRSDDGQILWNEVPILSYENVDPCVNNVLPVRKLFSTHVVDLMDNPGEILLIGSRKAYQYQRFL